MDGLLHDGRSWRGFLAISGRHVGRRLEDICSLSWVIWGLEGSALWRELCSDMRAAISGVMWG